MHTKCIYWGAVALLALVAFHSAVQGTTITVTTSEDFVDAGDDPIIIADLPGPDGVISLSEAICAANNNPGTDRIEFDIPGEGPHTIQLVEGLPTINETVIIDGYTQPGAQPNSNPVGQGLNTVLKIVLDGSNVGEGQKGLLFDNCSNNSVRGLTINSFSSHGCSGIEFWGSSSNMIEGNFIGTDVTGTEDRGNDWCGVVIENGADNTIGGTTPEARNLISCCGADGVLIRYSGATGNVVQGNFIGTDVTGTADLGNGSAGVCIEESATNNTIGGDVPEARNVISGNEDGIWINGPADNNVVEGNYIGTDVTGTAVVGNSQKGVLIAAASGNRIGGINAGSRNLISGNRHGVFILSCDDNVVQGNLIGTDVTGTADLGNLVDGVRIDRGSGNTIGNPEPGCSVVNVISGNNYMGVFITGEPVGGIGSGATANKLINNYIGLDVTGTADLGNGGDGVRIYNASSNTIGGWDFACDGNVISGNDGIGVNIIGSEATGNEVLYNFIGTDVTGTVALGNSSDGVLIDSGTGNAILSNTIFSNGGLGIDLTGDGVTGNDPGDGDAGANNLQNFPVLTSATPTAVQGTLNSMANTEFTLEFFSNSECDPSGHGEGENFLGSTTLTTDGGGNANFSYSYSVSEGQFITATATDPDGNTSELCECAQVREPCVITVTSPNGGETWSAGETETIAWTSEATSGIVVIEYSTDGGNVWQLFTGNIEDVGVYEWIVPGTPSENTLVVVCDAGDSTCCDMSNDVFTIDADCDFAITHIAVSNPVSVNYPTSIRVAITNLSSLDMALGNAYIDILDEGGESIFFGDVHPLDRIYQDPFFLFPAGDTLYAYEYDWTPTESGIFYLKVFLEFPCDTFSVNDIMDTGPVTVSGPGTGLLGYFDQYTSERDTVYSLVEGGPAVRYTIPKNMPRANVHTLYIGAVFENPEASFWVYLFGPGGDDTTFGEELIEPFEFFPQEVDSTGLIVIDLTGRPDYENLIGLSGDFWVHLKASQPMSFGFTARPTLPDTGVARNWYYVWSAPRSGRNYLRGFCQPPGYMDPFNRGWEELVGLDYSTCLLERGDVTRDGVVNVLDVLAVVNHILNIIVIEDLETLCRADCNNDAAINVLDALGIANVILGIGECKP